MRDLNKELFQNLSEEELMQISGGTLLTNKTPKYSVGTYVYFNHETYGENMLGVVQSIMYLPEEHLDQYPDGFVYVIHNAAGIALTSWTFTFVTENQITGIL